MPRNNKRKKKLSNFKKFLCIYCGILLLAGVITLIMLHSLLKDYEEGMPVFEKYSTRGVIIRDGKIATQHGSAGDYKILGGGVEPGEKLEDALIREVR